MGSVCCVPAKPERSSSRNHDRWSQEPHWRMNGNFSPPLSNRWHDKSIGDDIPASSANDLHLYRSSFSSSSRGSRRGSSRFLGGHQRTISSSLFSQDPSPSNSFHMNPLASSSQICPLVDMIPAAPSGITRGINHCPLYDTNSSPCVTITSSKEGCVSASALSTVDSSTSFYSTAEGEYLQPPQRQFVNNHSFKAVHPFPNKQVYGLAGSTSSPLPVEVKSSSMMKGSGDMESSAGGSSDWWSMQTFSDLVASSRRERVRWMSTGSPESICEGSSSMDGDFSSVERLRECTGSGSSSSSSYSCGAAEGAGAAEALVCGLCCRWLSQRSPLGCHKMVGNMDLPSAAVLACGHVFHADCLEHATCDAQRQDPTCPQCAAAFAVAMAADTTSVATAQSSDASAAAAVGVRGDHHRGLLKKKMSRIGVVTDDVGEEERKKKKMMMVFPKEKSKSLHRRAFSFKSKQSNNNSSSSSTSSSSFDYVGSGEMMKSKKSISFSQGSLDSSSNSSNNSKNNSNCNMSNHSRKGSFRYLRGWSERKS